MRKLILMLSFLSIVSADTILVPIDSNFVSNEDIMFYCMNDRVIAVVGSTEMKVIWSNPYKNNLIETLECKDYNVWEKLNG